MLSLDIGRIRSHFVIHKPVDLDAINIKATLNQFNFNPHEYFGYVDPLDLEVIKAKLSTIGSYISMSDV